MNGYEKIFRTLDEQIQILVGKGLIIKDVDKAKSILFRENYFFLSGYRHIFMASNKDSKFVDGTTFEELYAMFTFDRKIRNIFFSFILTVENNFKSMMSYILSKKYGYKEKDYLNPQNFVQDSMRIRQVHDVLNKMRRQIRINGKEHTATLHYMNNYGYIPLWILVKVLSFGIMSELYGILKDEDQMSIASIFNLRSDTLSIYLSLISNYRNICAHEEVLYDHRTQRSIPDCKYHNILNIEKNAEDEYQYGKNDLFALIIILRQILLPEEFRELVNEIAYEADILNGRVNSVPINKILNSCGFPDNWKDILDI